MSKRPGFQMNMKNILDKKQKTDAKLAATVASAGNNAASKNQYLSSPVVPDTVLAMFLTQARSEARKFLPKELQVYPIKKPFCEVEARLGILKIPFGSMNQRITSSGAKHAKNGRLVQTFQVSHIQPNAIMEPGISRTHFFRWTQAGLSEPSPISQALGVTDPKKIKADIVETEYIETVYAGYSNKRRVCYAGLHPPVPGIATTAKVGKMESKSKLTGVDLTIPAASYDFRINLATEKVLDPHVPVSNPPPGWDTKRVKRRRSYTRRDNSIAWQIDVTEVTSTHVSRPAESNVAYEIEMELREQVLLQLINEESKERVQSMAKSLSQQLWWMLSQINPLNDVVDVEEKLQDHPDKSASRLALATCGALKKYLDAYQKGGGATSGAYYDCPIATPNEMPSAALSNMKFVGCMPVNFSRHNLEEVQRSPDNGYFLSEKTDGVRHFMIFTGSTVVLVDRAMRGKQIIPITNNANTSKDPMHHVLSLIQPGTVFDGEVVMHRSCKAFGGKPRPIFIVFDVLALSVKDPILQLPFEQRYKHLLRASFRTPTANRDMFDIRFVNDPAVALPLVRKNFVKRTDLHDLLSHVVEERGIRTYRNGEFHNHMTDGIIFQPNLPYVCGTDVNLLKWKYLDTVTIDVELLPPKPSYNHRMNDDDDEEILRVGCLGDEGTVVDMTRYVKLPTSERRRLEADRSEVGGKIAEVGFDPETGEWYYLCMRGDKIAPNHISTVLGTLLELAESLTTEELQYRMSIPNGHRDTYRKDLRGMLKQLLDHQRRKQQR